MSFWDVENNQNKENNITFEDTIAKRESGGCYYFLVFSKEELKKGINFAQVKKKKKKKKITKSY